MERENGWNAVFWCNHDQPRAISRLGMTADTGRNLPKCWQRSSTCSAARRMCTRGRTGNDQPALRGYFPVPGC
ncbi:MAG: alpha-amylase family glycosyl hydrolase [Enterocloster bolteae]